MSETNETNLLAPFEIWEVMLDNRTIKFKKPLVLTPEFLPDDPDEPDENEYLSVKYPELNIDVFAENREELWEAVCSCIRMDWKHYVERDDSRHSRQTKALKDAYLKFAEAVDG